MTWHIEVSLKAVLLIGFAFVGGILIAAVRQKPEFKAEVR